MAGIYNLLNAFQISSGGGVLGDEKGLGISVSAKHSKGEFVNVKLEIPEQWGIHIRKP